MSSNAETNFSNAAARQIRDISARDHDVPHRRRLAQIFQNRLVTTALRRLEFPLRNLGNAEPHQIHPRAMAAILRDRWRATPPALSWDSGGSSPPRPTYPTHEDCRGRLWDGSATSHRDRRTSEHIAANRIMFQIRDIHGVEHLRRHAHRHRRALFLVSRDILGHFVGKIGPQELL